MGERNEEEAVAVEEGMEDAADEAEGVVAGSTAVPVIGVENNTLVAVETGVDTTVGVATTGVLAADEAAGVTNAGAGVEDESTKAESDPTAIELRTAGILG
jgi:hypothetical protein